MIDRGQELTALVAAFDRRGQIETAYNLLLACGIDEDRISTLIRPDPAARARPGEPFSRSAPAAATGAMLGSYVGAALGPFWPAGTIAGGLIGWLVGLGLPRGEAEDYGERLLDGQPILVVRVQPAELPAVQRALRQAEAKPVALDTIGEAVPLVPVPLAARVAGGTPILVGPGGGRRQP